MPTHGKTFDGLLEALPDAVLGIDEAGVIRLVNTQAESLFGHGRDDLVGVSLERLVPESFGHVQAARRRDPGAAASTRPMGMDQELRARRADGTEFPVDIIFVPLDTGDGVSVLARAREVSTPARATGIDVHRAERLLAIVEHSDDAIVGKTLDGTITSWNPGAERMYGYSAAEMIGRSIHMLSADGRRAEMSAILARIGAGEDVDHWKTERVRKDGTVFQVSLSITPIRDADGVIVGASTIARDISETSQAFEAARSMIETSHDCLVALSPDGKITDVNEATVRLTGVPRDKLIGTSFSDYFTNPRKADEVYQGVLGDGLSGDYLLTLRHHNGQETVIEVLYNASAYRDASGNVLGVFAAARDVSDQRGAREYARSLIEATMEALVTISPEGRITDVNEAMVRLTGISRDKLIGTSFSEYFTDPQKAEAVYQGVFEQGSVTDQQLTLLHTNAHDSEREVLYNASVYRDVNGAVLGVVATARDITDQIQAQRENAERQAAEKDRIEELEKFQRLTVGRELRMIELKKEIEYFKKFGPENGSDTGDVD